MSRGKASQIDVVVLQPFGIHGSSGSDQRHGAADVLASASSPGLMSPFFAMVTDRSAISAPSVDWTSLDASAGPTQVARRSGRFPDEWRTPRGGSEQIPPFRMKAIAFDLKPRRAPGMQSDCGSPSVSRTGCYKCSGGVRIRPKAKRGSWSTTQAVLLHLPPERHCADPQRCGGLAAVAVKPLERAFDHGPLLYVQIEAGVGRRV